MEPLHQPARVPRAAARQRMAEREQAEAPVPRASRERDVLLFLLEHAPLERWQRDVLDDRPRRGLLLRAAGPDQDHERGLGHLLALQDHDARRRSTPPRSSTTPTTTRARWPPRPASSTRTSSASSCSATSRTAGTRGASARSATTATTSRRKPQLGHAARRSAGRRSSRSASIYNDVTFIDEFLTLEFCQRAEALHLRLQRAHRALRDREPRVQEGEGEAALHS